MGLLEQAQQKKSTKKDSKQDNEIEQKPEIKKEEKSGLLVKAREKKQENKKSGLIRKPKTITSKKQKIKKTGLLKKAKKDTKEQVVETQILEEESKQYETGLLAKAKKAKEPEKKVTKAEDKAKKIDENRELIEKKEGFGYKGLGIRKIIFDKQINEYIYEVEEPELNEDELETKKELSRLFKMLADINVTNATYKEKKEYLETTLEKIIEYNNIKFIPKKKKDEGSSLTKKLSLSKKKAPEKEEKKEPEEEKIPFENEQHSKDKIFYHLFREFLGYGKIDIIMNDEGIEDISCDGHHVPIFIYHKKYDAITTNVKFENEEVLNSFVVRLAQICGKQISIYSPIVDGKLPDGSRLQTTLARTVTRGSTFTIRKFKENPLTPVDLIKYKSFSLDMAAYFWMAIEKGSSILFCGGTASGKTTALNALSLFIPPQHKIISIEDTREVSLPHKNWIAGTTRQGFSASDDKTGKDIDMFDLIRAALRQRPKVIMVGEVRGKEAYSLFQAMATGHTAYSTVHASTIHTLIQRLENPPIELPRALLTSLDIIVFQNAIDISGKTVRRMTSVTEVIKLDPDTNQLIFMEPFRWVSKTDDRFDSSGNSKILNNIKIQNDWSDQALINELENRKTILKWMIEKDIKDYIEVGKIVANYSKYPDEVVKVAREALKK
jgi:flagellar protein FlaI